MSYTVEDVATATAVYYGEKMPTIYVRRPTEPRNIGEFEYVRLFASLQPGDSTKGKQELCWALINPEMVFVRR